MNQGRVWCVVSPTVGLPLLLGSVAATSLIVHACVMTNTTWMSNYWQGRARVATSDSGTAQPVASTQTNPSAFTLSIAPVAGVPGRSETSFVVTVAPNPAAAVTASAEPAAESQPATVAIAASDPR